MHFPYFMGEFHQSVRDGDRCIQFASPFKPRTDTSHSQYLPCAFRLLLSAFYCLLATNFTRSRTRQEYPHSLSYHEVTFTQFPSITFVKPASTIEERGSPRKSAETNSSSVYPRMPLSGPSAAFFSASCTSSVVVLFSTKATRSTSETLGVGTRMA